MRRLLRNPAGEAVDRVYRIQFTRPPVDTSAWRWRLVDRGRLPFGDGAGAEVPIQVEQKGALYIVKPAQPLRYSRNYSLELLTGVPSANGQRVSAANGTSIEIAGGSVASFPTLDYLNPFISYGGAVLKALEPEESVQMFAKPQLSGSPNVTYRWAQIGGTPVVIDQPTKPEVRVSLAGAGTGLGKATLELTLALADGTSEKTTYTLRTLHDTSGPWVSFIRFPAISANALAARVEWNGPAVGDLVLSENQGRLEIVYTEATGSVGPYASWGLALANAGNQRLVVGKYLNAWALNSVSPPLGVPNLDFSFAGTKLAPFGSEFEVFEIDRDSDGRVTKLALDYVVRGVGDFSPVTGSVRFNSSRPPTRP